MSNISVVRFTEKYYDKWENLVLNQSCNGTFLQSRKFLDYHKDRFVDHSLLFLKGDTLMGVCPACEEFENGEKKFISHKGSTFGGIIIADNYLTISNISLIIEALEEYLVQNDFKYCLLKITGDIFSKKSNNLISYLLYKNNYSSYEELSFCIEFKNLTTGVVENFKSKTRNLYNASLKNNLEFRLVENDDEIAQLYEVLCKSLQKFDTKPVHTLEELNDLYYNRLAPNMRYYGVFSEGKLIAGSVVFIINNIFHTQYLCADPDFLHLKPMDFLDANLIIVAKDENFAGFSFGISTENHGYVLNEGLAKYKEGFGTDYYLNRSHYKTF